MGINEDKKINRKQRRHQQIVTNETGVVCLTEPTKVSLETNFGPEFVKLLFLEYSYLQCRFSEWFNGRNSH